MGISRRSFLFLTGGAGAAAAAEPGRKVLNRLIPWVVPPEAIRPGEWAFFATTCRECPAGCGMHLWHRDGRVTKAEGNPQHPVSRGGLCARGQSALQGLYDPDRVKTVTVRPRGETPRPSSWKDALKNLSLRLRESGGRVAVLSDLQTGALAEVLRAFVGAFGSDRLLFYEPFRHEALRAAHGAVFGRPEIPAYNLEECDYVLSFAADFLETWVSPVEFATRFASLRTVRDGRVGRLAYVGPRLSMTAANADDFVQTPPGRERWAALAVLQEMLERGLVRREAKRLKAEAEKLGAGKAREFSGLPAETIAKLARDFGRGRSIALAGPTGGESPAARDTAVAAALLNLAAGSVGTDISFARRHALGGTATGGELRRFLDSMTPQDLLFIVHANPFFTLPGEAESLRRAGTVVHLTTLPDETAEAADWVLPVDTPLESWGDYEPYGGFHTLLQPTMARLYDTRMAGDIFIALADAAGRPLRRPGGKEAPPHFPAWLGERWRDVHRASGAHGDFGAFWHSALQRGGFWGAAPGEEPSAAAGAIPAFAPPERTDRRSPEAELWLWPSIYLYDGRLANRGWMQENPDPVTTAAWGSWVDLHPERARVLGVRDGDVVSLATEAGAIELPARITEEVGADAVAVPFGQGHTASGLGVARGIGDNPWKLLGKGTEGIFPRVALRRTGRRETPVYASASREQHERAILQSLPLSQALEMKPGEGGPLVLPTPAGYAKGRDFYPPHAHRKHRWAMAIDLQRCIGCQACAVACYAENNVAVVGRDLVAQGREMAWLKVVPYRGGTAPGRIAWLPLPCQHCDAAPCEPVCPVFAAVHNEEGLNAQIYNRCIGTRYCSNNCPYKVRRFNWFDPRWKPPLELQLNPEVTVRSRGVMEKCTFCVQRIRQAEYRARLEKRPIRDGEIQPACAQSCPTRVYTFGDLNDPQSEVARIFREDPRRYQVLRELNTKPAVAYLKRIECPN